MSMPQAADLPVYSIVGAQFATFIKADMPSYDWLGTTTPRTKTNAEMDAYLADGAKVLRVGEGAGQ